YRGSITGEEFYTNKTIWDDARGGRQISERDLEHILALYRGEIAWTDRNLGELFDALDAEGRLDNAWIAVTADHGEEFFEHGRRGHRQTLFAEQVHIPLLIVPPVGTGGPRRSDASAALSDLAPTLCEAVGLGPVGSHAGRSLVPALRGESLGERPALHSLMRTVVSTQGIKHRVLDGVTTGDVKLVRELVAKDGELQLRSAVAYDLAADPGELAPTSDLSDPRLVAAWGVLEAEHARLRDLAAALPSSDAAERSSAAKEMFLSQLSALGYMDDGEAAERVEPPWGFQPPPAVSLDSAKGE
ncbi:MAG: sulfatase family protein, partial [Planctomycetota bacterium]